MVTRMVFGWFLALCVAVWLAVVFGELAWYLLQGIVKAFT